MVEKRKYRKITKGKGAAAPVALRPVVPLKTFHIVLIYIR